MRELSLYSGAGGGLLGSLLLGWRPIGYVEINEYCQRVIAQRIADGYLPAAPIFTDVHEFLQSGSARQYRGFTDVLTGGFPCQPFSVAGKRAGARDERNLWPATLATIREVRPPYCYFENVPGLLASGYFERILCDLTESGYSVRWRCLSAAELGANHRRDRLWIVAHTTGERLPNGRSAPMGRSQSQSQSERHCGEVPDADRARSSQSRPIGSAAQHTIVEPHGDRGHWWQVEPDVGRVVDELAFRVDRLRAIGNGQIPQVAAAAWRLLTEDLD